MRRHWTLRLVFAGAAVAVLAGCEMRPVIASATVERSGGSEVIRVRIPTRDAKAIKRRQMNFYLIVSECAGHDGRSALDATIGGARVAEFRYPTVGEVTTIEGVMPHREFDGYRNPCAMVEGGGYFTGTLRSDPVEIVRHAGNDMRVRTPAR